MSKITEPILLDSTGREMVNEMRTQNMLLGILSGTNINSVQDIRTIRRVVQSGNANKVFNIGDQIIIPWTDTAANKMYEAPFDVVHFGDVTLQDGEVVPGMYLQMHYCTPFGVQFDQNEAFYKAEEELSEGTYNITVGADWGTHCKKGTYQFTLTKPVPAGGLLAGFMGMPDQPPANWKVSSYEDGKSAAIETVAVTEGSEGTTLGTFVPAGSEGINSLHRLAYGYNRWSQSAIRQWLNSKESAGNWWTSQNDYDRAPDQLATKDGFMKGFDEEFLSCIQAIKVRRMVLTTIT